CRAAGHSVEKERNKSYAILTRQRGIHAVKPRRVLAAEIGRRLHPREHDDDTAGLGALDDRREIALQLARREAPKAVVAAERYDEDANLAVERPVEPTETTGRRISRYSGVHHLVIQPLIVETLLQHSGVRLFSRKAKPGGQAVAKDDDARSQHRLRCGTRRWRRGRRVSSIVGQLVVCAARDRCSAGNGCGASQTDQGREWQAQAFSMLRCARFHGSVPSIHMRKAAAILLASIAFSLSPAAQTPTTNRVLTHREQAPLKFHW